MDKAQQSKQVIDLNSDPSKPLPTQTKLTFYTDPQGLYATANLRTKKILKDAQQNGEINSDKIKVQNLGYEKKITGNNFCSHFFTPNVEQYYVCEQCSFSLGGFSTMCYCKGCFDEQRHIGHNVSAQTPYSDRAYCDCGRLERFKKQSFCKNHSSFDVQMPCQIDPEQEKQYIQSFITLLEVGIQKQNQQLMTLIALYLQKLNENSIYYNRMTFKLLTSQSTANKEKYKSQKYFFILSMEGYDFEKLMIHLGGDLRTRMNMIKFFSVYFGENDANDYLNYFSSSNFRQLVNLTAVQKLVDQGFSHDFMYQILKSQNYSKKYPQLMARILLQKVKSAKKLNQLLNFQNLQMQQFTVQLAELVLFKILQFYPSSQKIRKNITCQPDQQNPWSQFQIAESKQQVGQNLPYDVLKANKLIVKTISTIIVSNIQICRDIRVYLIKKGADPQRLEQIIYWLIVSTKLNCYSQGQNGNPFALITILLLIRDSPSKIQNIEKFWSLLLQKQAIKEEDEQNKQSKIAKYADIFHFVITVLFRTDIFCIMEKKKSPKMKKAQNKNFNSASQEQALQNWFRSFLYQRKTVSRSQIIQLKNSGVLNFTGAGKILNEICSYNEDQQMFNFSHSKAYKNIINQFPLIPCRLNYQALYNNTIHFGQQIKFEKGSLASDLFDQVLICKTLIPIFDKQWQRTIKKENYLLNETKDGYLYLFVLVVYDILTKGFNEAVRAKLEAIRKDQSLLSFYYCKQQDTKLIKRLLALQTQEQKQSPKIQLKNDKKILAEQKKKKIAQKFKKTRELMLQKIKSQTEGQLINENQETCILCHQKEKKNNSLVYLSSINKNNTICGAVHGKNNVSNTYISTCFHAIHVNCFIDYRKNSDLSFLCPLCQTQSNCIVPTSYSPQNKKLNRICQNAMIAHMVAAYRIYDVQSDFILIFKHLVESKGLNSLLQYSRYEQKKKLWLKNNQYLFQLMEKLYDNSGEQDKKRYLKSIDDFVEQIQACPKPICRLIQLLFAEALKSALSQTGDRQATKKILLELRSLLKNDEYLIIEEQLCQLFHDQNFPNLPQPTQEQINKQKTSLSFSLVRLPQKAIECQKIFKDKKCQGCTIQKVDYSCLMCGIGLCSNCRQEHAKIYHNQAIIYFCVNNFKVECTRKHFYTNDDIYENQFKVAYSERFDYDDMEKSEYYTLNELKFQKTINKFLEN